MSDDANQLAGPEGKVDVLDGDVFKGSARTVYVRQVFDFNDWGRVHVGILLYGRKLKARVLKSRTAPAARRLPYVSETRNWSGAPLGFHAPKRVAV